MSNSESELTEEERRVLKSVGVRSGTRKPISLWAVQVLFAFYSLLFAFVGVRSLLSNPGRAIFAVGLSGGILTLIVAIQRRRSWARLASSVALGLLCVIAVLSQFRDSAEAVFRIQPAERGGAAVGGILLCLIYVVLATRVAFGASVREYLKNKDGKGEA